MLFLNHSAAPLRVAGSNRPALKRNVQVAATRRTRRSAAAEEELEESGNPLATAEQKVTVRS